MPIKIPQLPSIPAGTITGSTSIPVAKTTTDPKTYKMTLSQTLAWLQSNGLGGGGYSGYSGFSGFSGVSGTSTVGPSGGAGGDGRTAYGLQLVASSYVFQASSNPTTGAISLTATPFAPTSITLNAVLQNLTGTATFNGQLYNINNSLIGTIAPGSFGGSGNSRTITNTQFGSAFSCVVTASLVSGTDTYYDITTITRLQDATNALQGYLTNPAIVLASQQDGVLGPGEQAKATGLFQVFYGLNEVTTGVIYSVVNNGATSLITPVSAGGITTVNFTIGENTGIYALNSIDPNVIGASAIFRAQVFGQNIDRVVTLSKSRQGVTGPAGSAQAVFLNADTQVFSFDNTGTPTPSSQTANFQAVLSVLTGFPEWYGIQYYTDGTFNTNGKDLLGIPTGSTLTNFLTVTKFASALTPGKEVSSFVVSATHIESNLSDSVRIVKVTSGGQGFTSFLTNQNHTIGADSTGAVNTPLSAGNGYFRIYQGSNLVNNQYVVYGIKSTTTGMGVSVLNYPNANASYYVLTAFDPSLNTGSTILTATYSPVGGSPVSFEQVFSVTKSKAGPVGDVGPGIVYRGVYDTGTSYFRTSTRADAVVYPASAGSYYLAVTSGLGSTLGTPGAASGWALFGEQFSSVATGLLLAEDATILKTLVMGYQVRPDYNVDRGVIRSYGTSDWIPTASPQDGFWIGMDSDNKAKFRIGSTSNNLVWDGEFLSLSYGNSGILMYSGSSGTDMYIGMNTSSYEGNGIWLGRAGNSTTGVYKMSLVSPNGRSMKWTGSELVLNGATNNLETSGTVYLNKTGPDDDNKTGFWLGVSGLNAAPPYAPRAFFSVGSSDSWLKYSDITNTVQVKGVQTADGITVTSGLGLRYFSTSGSFTITGGTGNGAQYGAQIDLIGNNFSGIGSGGQLVLQSGDGAGGSIAFLTNNSRSVSTGPSTPDSVLGVQRMLIENTGRVIISREQYLVTTLSAAYNEQAGSLWARGNLGVGWSAEPFGASTSDGNADTGVIYAQSRVQSPVISAYGVGDPIPEGFLGYYNGSRSVRMGTNGEGERTVTDTPGIPGSGTGNNGDIYLVYS